MWLRLKPQQLHFPKLDASTRMAALEADAAFEGHFSPRLALKPFRHLGGVGIEFAVFPLREVDFVHDYAVEHDGDFRTLDGEGHAVPFTGGFDGALGRGLMAEEGTAAPVGGLFLPLLGAVVADLDFDARGHPVRFVAVVEEDAAVSSRLELELKIEHAVAVRGLGPDVLILGGGEGAVAIAPDGSRDSHVGQIAHEQVIPRAGVGMRAQRQDEFRGGGFFRRGDVLQRLASGELTHVAHVFRWHVVTVAAHKDALEFELHELGLTFEQRRLIEHQLPDLQAAGHRVIGHEQQEAAIFDRHGRGHERKATFMQPERVKVLRDELIATCKQHAERVRAIRVPADDAALPIDVWHLGGELFEHRAIRCADDGEVLDHHGQCFALRLVLFEKRHLHRDEVLRAHDVASHRPTILRSAAAPLEVNEERMLRTRRIVRRQNRPQPRHLRRARNHARERVRQLGEVEGELGVWLELGREGAGGEKRKEERFHERRGVIKHVPSFFARR